MDSNIHPLYPSLQPSKWSSGVILRETRHSGNVAIWLQKLVENWHFKKFSTNWIQATQPCRFDPLSSGFQSVTQRGSMEFNSNKQEWNFALDRSGWVAHHCILHTDRYSTNNYSHSRFQYIDRRRMKPYVTQLHRSYALSTIGGNSPVELTTIIVIFTSQLNPHWRNSDISGVPRCQRWRAGKLFLLQTQYRLQLVPALRSIPTTRSQAWTLHDQVWQRTRNQQLSDPQLEEFHQETKYTGLSFCGFSEAFSMYVGGASR